MATTNIAPGVLSGPIMPTMLRLAVPTIVVLVVETLVGVRLERVSLEDIARQAQPNCLHLQHGTHHHG
jgi:hypothetical protein